MIYFYKNALKVTHEFLADEAVLGHCDKKNYGQILLRQSLSGIQIALAHSFYHSNIKKRIHMMYQKKSGRTAWMNYLLAVPVVAFMAALFACSQYSSENPLGGETSVATEFKSQQNSKDEVFVEVDLMPRLAKCTEEEGKTLKDLYQCSNQELFSYIFSNLKYPSEAKDQDLEGKGFVQFTVNTEGHISDVEIVKDIGAGCGDAVLEVLNNMNQDGFTWVPGKKGDKDVNVQMTLPVTFQMAG